MKIPKSFDNYCKLLNHKQFFVWNCRSKKIAENWLIGGCRLDKKINGLLAYNGQRLLSWNATLIT